MKEYGGLDCSNGVHTLKITLQCGELRGSFTHEIGGNCKGVDILEFDAENDLDEYLMEHAKFENLEIEILDDDYFNIVLGKPEDHCSMEVTARELNDMVVALEIVDFVEDKEE